MGHYYQRLDLPGGFDYRLYELPDVTSRALRGPRVDLSAPYLACIGAAQTFGRFAANPFPALLAARLGIPVLNLGVGGAGPRHFETDRYMQVLNGAEAVVIQVMSGRSASNSLFDNSQSGGMTGRLRSDGSTVRADEFFSRLSVLGRHQIERVVEETRDDFVSSFIHLLRGIVVPRILFWFSTRTPRYADDYGALPHGILRAFPQLVNGRMIEELKTFADAYVECISDSGLPQQLWKGNEPIDGAVPRHGTLENTYYPAPQMHAAAADALEQPCRKFVGQRKQPPPTPTDEKFAIVAAARTGTNMLIGLLNDFRGCYAGSELFNVQNIADDIIPWHDISEADQPALLALRRKDPISFWKALCALSATRGVRSVGFKLLYSQGFAHREFLDHLAADTTIRVIHIKRRNLLRRYVSERQAYDSGKWGVGTHEPAESRAAVSIAMGDALASMRSIEEHQSAYDSMFAAHPVLEVIYEELAVRPARVAARAAKFLGLPPRSEDATVKHWKTGAEQLPDAIVDYEALRAKIRRWASFFDE